MQDRKRQDKQDEKKTIFLNSLNSIISAYSYSLFNILLILPFTILHILFFFKYLGLSEVKKKIRIRSEEENKKMNRLSLTSLRSVVYPVALMILPVFPICAKLISLWRQSTGPKVSS